MYTQTTQCTPIQATITHDQHWFFFRHCCSVELNEHGRLKYDIMLKINSDEWRLQKDCVLYNEHHETIDEDGVKSHHKGSGCLVYNTKHKHLQIYIKLSCP